MKFYSVITWSICKNLFKLLCRPTNNNQAKKVADVTETRNVIPSLEFKTCMTIKF